MIDYEKLKLAHELANEYSKSKKWDQLIYISVGMSKLELRYSIEIYKNSEDMNIKFDDGCQFTYCIDELITKLQELTKPNPKYEVRQKAWACLGQNVPDDGKNCDECNKLSKNIVERLDPIIKAQIRIDEILLGLLPKYYIKDSERNSTDDLDKN